MTGRLRLGAALGLAMLLAAAFAVFFIATLDQLITGQTPDWFDARPFLLCLGLVGTNVLSYLVWLSRWNVVAHTQLVFSVVAYVIPIFFLSRLEVLSSAALDTYYLVVAVGFSISVVGVLIGAVLVSPARVARMRGRRTFDGEHAASIELKVRRLAIASIVMVLLAFAVMGFAPALTPDPLVAKFFRGGYAAAYAPVAPLYRLGTTILTLLIPLIGYYVWKRRSTSWVMVFGLSVLVMLLGLLREPAVSGLLLLIGVALAARGRGLVIYFGLLIAAYFAGAALYSILSALGVPGFELGDTNQAGLLIQVAAGAPDVNDQLTFLRAWLIQPEFTVGRTWVGGLVPSNYEWNPSVWTLTTVNPGVDISQIASGGLRLPPPIWGYVSFGWPGVVVVCFGYGLLVGFLARLVAQLIERRRSFLEALSWIVLYVALLEVVPVFFRLSYLSVIQVVVVLYILRAVKPPTKREERLRRHRERSQAGSAGPRVRTDPAGR